MWATDERTSKGLGFAGRSVKGRLESAEIGTTPILCDWLENQAKPKSR